VKAFTKILAPIACTLTPGEYKARVARIRDLAARSLRSARRDDLRLVLTYAPEAAEEVRALVREEQACCAFLRFDIQDDALGIDVTVTAPEEARAAANDLFAHFAPEVPHPRNLCRRPRRRTPYEDPSSFCRRHHAAARHAHCVRGRSLRL
jgi:hypothetical protein